MTLFINQADRLLNDVVAKGQDLVGGFMTSDADTETLFALTVSGKVFCRTASRPNANFDRPNAKWHELSGRDVIPAHAEWIGAYRVERLARA